VEDQAMGNSSTVASSSASSAARHESRGVWILTAYGIAGLGLLGVLVYYFSTFVTH